MTSPQTPKFYACEHGESNTPDTCHLRAWALASKPGDEPPGTMPDDWYVDYASAPGGGLGDSASFG